MTPFSMIDRFRGVRADTLALVADLDQAGSERAPAPGVWSPGEVLDHLRLFDVLIVDDIEALVDLWGRGERPFLSRGLSDLGVKLPGVPAAFMPFFELPLLVTNIFVPRPLRALILRSRQVPARAPERAVPQKGQSLEGLRRELAGLPDRLQAMLEANPGLDFRTLRYYSPISGFTDAGSFLDLLTNHERRHQGQLRDILAAIATPG